MFINKRKGNKTMKKFLSIMAAVVAALGFASCSNDIDETVVEKAKQPIKLNISVADMNGDATSRAAKTGWVDGDKIMIWYQDASNNQAYPDLVIKYNGSAWVTDTEATVSGKTPSASGKLSAAYMSVQPTCSYYSGRAYYNAPEVHGSSYSCMPLTVYQNYINYTYTSGVLTANINNWTFVTTLKVLIKNLSTSKSADYFYLRLQNTTQNTTFAVSKGLTWDGEKNGTAGGNAQTGGVQESDGIAFYFSTNVNSYADATDQLKFTLEEYNGTNHFMYYTVTGKTITANVTTGITNVAIDYSNFAAE